MAKKSVEELVDADLQLEMRNVPLELIDFDPKNPNELSPEEYEQLKTDIRDFGFWQPCLVTPNGERYQMVDGEHRARILSELGATVVPSVIGDEWAVEEARMRLITMNKFRGKFVPIKLADLLSGLKETHSDAQIKQRIGMDDDELRGTLGLLEFGEGVEDALRDDLERERADAPAVMRFVLSQRDSEIVERVVSAAATGKIDRGQALTAVCREWEKNHKTTKKEAV